MTTVFDSMEYVQARENRLRNLSQHVTPWSLIGSRVLEVGCGTGELGEEFVKLGCTVVSVDARPEHITELSCRFPNRWAIATDLDSPQASIWGCPDTFGIVLCFGLLYHLAFPDRFLKRCAAIAPALYLETIVSDSLDPLCPFTKENSAADQSYSTCGCRPSPQWLLNTLIRLRYRVQDISSPVANWETAVFDWTPQNDGAWIRNGKTLRKMYICTQEPRV